MGEEYNEEAALASQPRRSHRNSTRESFVSMHPVHPEDQSSWLSKSYVQVLDNFMKYAVIAVFFIATAVSINWAIDLFDKTEMTWEAPDGTYAKEQRDMVKKYAPAAVGAQDYVIAVEWKSENDSRNILTVAPTFADLGRPNPTYTPVEGGATTEYTAAGVTAFTFALRDRVYFDWCDGVMPVRLTQPACTKTMYISLYSGAAIVGAVEPTAVLPFLGVGGTSTYIGITLQGENIGLENKNSDFADWIEDTVKELAPVFMDPAQMKAAPFSISGGVKEILSTVKKDLVLADGIAIPVSLIISMVALRNVRLMLIPLVMTLVTTFVSMAVVSGLANDMSISVLSPLVMISIMVALPVGNSLFMLNRFREALLEDYTVPEAVQRMLSSAGSTVFLSQLCLVLCCAIICFVDVEQVQSMGASMMTAVIVSALSSMLLCPSLLLVCTSFWQNAKERSAVLGTVGVWKKRETIALANQLKGRSSKYDSEDPGVVPHLVPELTDTKWHRHAARTQTASGMFSFLVLALLLIAISPFAITLGKNTKVTDSITVYLPRRDDFTETAFRLFEQFGYGLATQYTIMFLPPSIDQVPEDLQPYTAQRGNVFKVDVATADTTGNKVWNTLGGFMDQLNNVPNMNSDGIIAAYNFMGINFDGIDTAAAGQYSFQAAAGMQPSPGNYTPSLPWRAACLQYSTGALYGPAYQQFGVVTHMTEYFYESAYGRLKLNIDPLSSKGRDWAKDFRDQQESFNAAGGAQVYIAGMPVSSMSAMERVTDSWQWLAAAFVLLAFFILLVGTRSVMIAIRCVITTFCTVMFALGFASLTYCHDALGWIGIDAISRFEGGEIHYMVFIVAIPLLIGWCISHEVFAMSACLEWYHYHHLSSKEATKLGLVGVGWLNLLSGFIVAIAFIGHMFARLPIANQIAFTIFVGVLFDVLLIRCVIAPILMSPLGPNNWWPNHGRKGGEGYVQHEHTTPNTSIARGAGNPLDSFTMDTKHPEEDPFA